jgi:hypothetical protein
MTVLNAAGKGVYVNTQSGSSQASIQLFDDSACTSAIDSDPIVVPCSTCQGIALTVDSYSLVASFQFECPGGPLDFICHYVDPQLSGIDCELALGGAGTFTLSPKCPYINAHYSRFSQRGFSNTRHVYACSIVCVLLLWRHNSEAVQVFS